MCYNHPLEGDVNTPEALAKLLVTEKGLGCDIVETGCGQPLASLLTALRAGRAWFVNPKGFQGTLDVTVNGVSAMGGVLLTSAQTVPVMVVGSGLPAAGLVELVIGAVDYASDTKPATSVRSIKVSNMTGGKWNLDLWPSEGKYFRPVVRDGAGAIVGVGVGVGNPTWLLRTTPGHGIPAARKLPT
ncbi:hypothetical protein [Actinomadura sp. 6N118]|uniref:hypothetical protein n=1 Tax=Actinomadura sp. 6N118 TaxID=3375151 RepID=UPI00379630BE